MKLDKDNCKFKLYDEFGKFIDLEGIRTFVLEMGRGQTIIFVNGLAASCYTWCKVIKELNGKYHAIAMDFCGTGMSEKNNKHYNIELYTEQLAQLIDYYKANNVTLVGSSLGGGIALRYMLKHPEKVKRLVLIDSVGCERDNTVIRFLVSLFKYRLTRKIIELSLSKTLVKLIIKWAVENEGIINRDMIEAYYSPLSTDGAMKALTSLIRSLAYSDLNYEAVKSITAPVLIIWGDKDKWLSKNDSYKLHRDIKTSKLVILKNCGHGAQEEYSVTVAKLIENFMDM